MDYNQIINYASVLLAVLAVLVFVTNIIVEVIKSAFKNLPTNNGTLTADAKRSYYLPIIPRRSDHYRLKLTGTGGCRIYSLVRETYSGSELKSQQGRN